MSWLLDYFSFIKFSTSRQNFITLILIFFVFLIFFVSISFGSFNFSFLELFNFSESSIQKTVLFEIRIPRVLLAGFVGASLGLSGASLQGLFRNPLADPGLIGVSAGAALGAALVIVLGSAYIPAYIFNTLALPISPYWVQPLSSQCFTSLQRGFGYQGITYMLLIGIAVNAFASVGIGILTFISTDSELRGLTFWTMGSFGGASWQIIIPALLVIIVSIVG